MFERYIILIYMLYGLAFFILGLISLVEGRRNSAFYLVKVLPFLGFFGVSHGLAEWLSMLSLLPSDMVGLSVTVLFKIEVLLTAASFIFLLIFAGKLINHSTRTTSGTIIALIASIIFIFSFIYSWSLPAEISLITLLCYARFFLAFPGGVMAGIGMLLEAKNLRSLDLSYELDNIKSVYRNMGHIFIIYGLVAGLIVTPMTFGLAAIINAQVLKEMTGIPIQALRALCAVFLAFYSIKALSIYEYELKKAEQQNIQYLRRISIIDEASGLYNHRYFQEKLMELTSSPNKKLSLLLLDLDHFKKYNDSFGHPEGDRLLKEVGTLIRSMTSKNDIVARYGGDELAIILPNTNKATAFDFSIALKKKIATHSFGVKYFSEGNTITASIGVASFPDIADNKDALIQFADLALYKAKRFRNRVEVYSSVLDELKSELDSSEVDIINTVKTLISVINAKDQYTFGHSERVMALAVNIASKLKLTEDEIKNIRYGAYLHDIGKIEIDRDLLNKEDPLSGEEYSKIKQHPNMGTSILKPIKSLKEIMPYVLNHHERFDGEGYPNGLKGKDIPLGARIIAVADSFDAMITTRPYKQGKSLDEAIAELKLCSGSQFDPDIVNILLTILEDKDNNYISLFNAS